MLNPSDIMIMRRYICDEDADDDDEERRNKRTSSVGSLTD